MPVKITERLISGRMLSSSEARKSAIMPLHLSSRKSHPRPNSALQSLSIGLSFDKISMNPSIRASVSLALSGKVSSASGPRRLYGPSEQLGNGEVTRTTAAKKRQCHRHAGRVREKAEQGRCHRARTDTDRVEQTIDARQTLRRTSPPPCRTRPMRCRSARSPEPGGGPAPVQGQLQQHENAQSRRSFGDEDRPDDAQALGQNSADEFPCCSPRKSQAQGKPDQTHPRALTEQEERQVREEDGSRPVVNTVNSWRAT